MRYPRYLVGGVSILCNSVSPDSWRVKRHTGKHKAERSGKEGEHTHRMDLVVLEKRSDHGITDHR